jgi:hypothetical protein
LNHAKILALVQYGISKMAKIIGADGIFFKAKSPLDLAKWYEQYLGLDILEWGGAIFPAKQPSDSK